jgi:hypothetical protein
VLRTTDGPEKLAHPFDWRALLLEMNEADEPNDVAFNASAQRFDVKD